MNFEVVILTSDEVKVTVLKDLLSNYYSLNVTAVCQCAAEAIEYLNNHQPTIFFLDMDYAEVLRDVRKPPFVVGLCDSISAKKLKRHLSMGFFEIFCAPFKKRDLNSIMGKILNIYGTYNKVDQRVLQKVEEENTLYNAEESMTKSVFIHGARNEESIRIIFDDVLYFIKVGNQVCVVFEDGDKKYFRGNLKMFHSKFPKSKFLKINKSVVVNMDKVKKVVKNMVIIDKNTQFKLSRSFKKPFMEMLPH
jgi:DNA-binding LytR/AlgR family response regulator